MRLGPEEDRLARDRRGCHHAALAEGCPAELAVLAAGRERERRPVLREEVDRTVREQRGGRVGGPPDPSLPDLGARLRVETGHDAGLVGDGVDQVSHQERRRARADAPHRLPGDVRVGHVSLSVGADGEQLRGAAPAGDVHEPVGEERARGGGVRRVAHAPQLAARQGVERQHGLRRRADELRPARGLDHDRRRVCLLHVAVVRAEVVRAVGLPDGAARLLVERHGVLHVVAVEVHDQQLAVEDRRRARAPASGCTAGRGAPRGSCPCACPGRPSRSCRSGRRRGPPRSPASERRSC